jgi:hypothetical protein
MLPGIGPQVTSCTRRSRSTLRLGAHVLCVGAILLCAAGCRGKPRIAAKRPSATASADAMAPSAAACDVTAAEVVNALPAVQRSLAQAVARADASNGKLRYGGIGPQDLNDPDGFSASYGLHSDESYETVVSYHVDREGLLTVDIALEGPVVVAPADLRRVARVCRR